MRTLPIMSLLLCLLTGLPAARASVAVRLSFDELVDDSDRVVVASLKSSASYWGQNQRRIFTRYIFTVHENVAGQGAQEIEVVQPGGTVGDLGQIVHGYPDFEPGVRYLLLLNRLEAFHRVVGLSQGVFTFAEQDGREVLRQQIEGLSLVERDSLTTKSILTSPDSEEASSPGDALRSKPTPGGGMQVDKREALARIRTRFEQRDRP